LARRDAMIEDYLDKIICGDNCEAMRMMPSGSIDLVVTSPPYDDLRTYGGHSWDFYGVAWNLKRLLKPGGVIVWVVGDETVNGSETGSSAEQASHFRKIGLNQHDTMIYQKHGMPTDPRLRYFQRWEFMFVFSLGKPRCFNAIADVPSSKRKQHNGVDRRGDVLVSTDKQYTTPDFSVRGNVWEFDPRNCEGSHPAPFPESLARDHIVSWSNEGDIVLDPFSGSGTTAKMARELGRKYIGIEVNPDYCEMAEKRLSQQLLFN
jgi:DNA modification methylase